MRVFTIFIFCASLLASALAVAQAAPQVPGRAYYGYGPYVPLITTPEISLQTVSPSAVGARNATYGLLAGARNSTISMMNGNTSSNYTEAVWNSGGDAPIVSAPEVSLVPRALHSGRIRMEERRAEHERAEGEAPRAWTYYGSTEETANAVEAANAAKSARRATRTYTNQDVDNENQKNGMVKYDNKTEKIQ
jgi:hypothetical protein